MYACRFRKIQQLGFTTEYKDPTSKVGAWLRHVFGLAFLPPNQVGDCFAFDFMEDIPDARLLAFADSLTDNYIDEERAIFPPNIWAADTPSIARTTNACESFHSRYNSYCPSPHPNINVFLHCLKAMQIDTYIKMNSTTETPQTRKEVLLSQKFIAEKIIQYQNGNIGRYDFVKCVSYKYSSVLGK